MCGILYAKRNSTGSVSEELLKRYYIQRNRGVQGFGFIAIQNGKVVDVERFEDEQCAKKALKESKSSAILFHHRMPTSTPNYKDMTHPIVVKNKILDNDYYVVHNGVLRNEYALKLKHEKMGFVYTTNMRETLITETLNGSTKKETESFNDSESLAIEVALFLDGKQDSINTVGTVSFICIEATKSGVVKNIHYGHNFGNPLILENENGITFLKSAGVGEIVTENKLATIDFITNETTTRPVQIGTLYEPVATIAGYGYGNEGAVGGYDPFYQTPQSPKATSQMPLIGSHETDPYYDFDEDYEEYKYTDAHLLDLWEEIEALKGDITGCSSKMATNALDTPEQSVYNSTYIHDCKTSLQQLEEEATLLEDFLSHSANR